MCLSFVGRCSWLVVCSLFVIDVGLCCCSLVVVSCVMLFVVGWRSLLVVCYLVFVVCCGLFVLCC